MQTRKRVILSIAAHGDDAEFMAGGTLAKMVDEGHDLYLLIATDNDRGSYRLTADQMKAVARPEAEAAGRVLGAKGVFLLGYRDGDLCEVPQTVLRGQIMAYIRKLRADIIFCWDPFAPFENHPDHRALAFAVLDASSFSALPLFHPEQLEGGLQPQRVSEWYFYSKAGWETNWRIDISDTIDRKLQALYCYESQMVLTIDDLLGEARTLEINEEQLAFIDPLQYQPFIDLGVRARDAKVGAACDAPYAEAFRHQRIELPEIFQA